MRSIRFLARFVGLFCLFLVACRAEDGECAAAGECGNPDAAAAAAAEDGDAAEERRMEEAAVPDIQSFEKEDASCPSRPFIIQCAGKYLDVNQNGMLERIELQSAIDALPWYSRGIISILGSVDKMMRKCDVDGDGAISMDYDMSHNGETCLATCFKRLAFQKSFFPDCKPEMFRD